MIEVRVKLKSARGEEHNRMLGVLVICNDGTGTEKLGNYTYALSHAGYFFGKRKEPYKNGRVIGFPRNGSPYRLIYRCLKDAGET